MAAYGKRHLVGLTSPYHIADNRACRRGKRYHHHKRKSADVACKVGYGKRLLAKMLDIDKKINHVDSDTKLCTITHIDTLRIER